MFPPILFSVYYTSLLSIFNYLAFNSYIRNRRDYMTGTIYIIYSISLTLKITRIGPKLNLFVVYKTRLPPTILRDLAGLTISSKI